MLPLLLLFVSACETTPDCAGGVCVSDEEVLARAGAVRLTPDQVRAHVSDRTEAWIHGAAFYQPDGELRVKWRKARYKSTWELAADGTICFKLRHWPRRCHFYMIKEDEVYMLDEGKNIGVRSMYRGNRLNDVGRYLPLGERSS